MRVWRTVGLAAVLLFGGACSVASDVEPTSESSLDTALPTVGSGDPCDFSDINIDYLPPAGLGVEVWLILSLGVSGTASDMPSARGLDRLLEISSTVEHVVAVEDERATPPGELAQLPDLPRVDGLPGGGLEVATSGPEWLTDIDPTTTEIVVVQLLQFQGRWTPFGAMHLQRDGTLGIPIACPETPEVFLNSAIEAAREAGMTGSAIDILLRLSSRELNELGGWSYD